MLEIPDIFWGRMIGAGSEPTVATYEVKMRVPPPPPPEVRTLGESEQGILCLFVELSAQVRCSLS